MLIFFFLFMFLCVSCGVSLYQKDFSFAYTSLLKKLPHFFFLYPFCNLITYLDGLLSTRQPPFPPKLLWYFSTTPFRFPYIHSVVWSYTWMGCSAPANLFFLPNVFDFFCKVTHFHLSRIIHSTRSESYNLQPNFLNLCALLKDTWPRAPHLFSSLTLFILLHHQDNQPFFTE